MAAAERIRDLRHAAAGGTLSRDHEAALALSLVEDVLWGYDINLTATHMAATTLGMLSPSTEFGRMNIFRTLLGVARGQARIGSLEFLDRQPQITGWPQAPGAEQVDDGPTRGGEPPPMDLVIMNPPFTRASLRYDQFSKEEERALKSREQALFDGHAERTAIHLSGTSTPFAVLGEQLLGKTETLALLLPSVIPTAPSGLGLRQFLARQFHVDTIVYSHDPERINMSENTRIGEVLIICRRWNDEIPKPPTKFYNLAKNPANAFEALELHRQIAADSPRQHTTQEMRADQIERGDWSAINFLSPMLTEGYRDFRSNRLEITPPPPRNL